MYFKIDPLLVVGGRGKGKILVLNGLCDTQEHFDSKTVIEYYREIKMVIDF